MDAQTRAPATGGVGCEGRLERRRRPSEVTQVVQTTAAEPDAPVRINRRSAELRPSAAYVLLSSDTAIQREIVRLFDEQLDPACRVEVRVSEGGVILRGRVSCPLARMLAEDLAYSVHGVRECVSAIEVVRSDPRTLARSTCRTPPHAR